MQIVLKFGGKSVEFALDSSAVAQEFYNMLPLSLEFSDYDSAEKASNALNVPLKAKGKAHYKPQIGDLFYFAPWGNLGIFYKQQPPHSGLVYLGTMLTKHDLALIKAQNATFWVEIVKK